MYLDSVSRHRLLSITRVPEGPYNAYLSTIALKNASLEISWNYGLYCLKKIFLCCDLVFDPIWPIIESDLNISRQTFWLSFRKIWLNNCWPRMTHIRSEIYMKILLWIYDKDWWKSNPNCDLYSGNTEMLTTKDERISLTFNVPLWSGELKSG